jgi:hypothetical protein
MSPAIVVCAALLLSGDVRALLRGIDTVPSTDAVAVVPAQDLVAVVVDDRHGVVVRARAARLLGGRDVDDGAIDTTLAAIGSGRQTPAALRAQVTLALAERAARRGDLTRVAAMADAAIADPSPEVARAGVLVWWLRGGDDALTRLRGLARRTDALGGASRGRLREAGRAGAWRRLDGDAIDSDVLQPRHGGSSPAR